MVLRVLCACFDDRRNTSRDTDGRGEDDRGAWRRQTIFIIDAKSATVSRSFKVKLPPEDRGLKILALDD